MRAGIYISVPFCRSKCTYCSFASGVFSAAQMERYVGRVAADLNACRSFAGHHGAETPEAVDSIYLGGGTPTLLQPKELTKLFFILHSEFAVIPDAEITIECAPGTLTGEILDAFAACGVNRVSLGVQSFIDREAASVARLHTRETTLRDIERLRAAGIHNINVDLIAGMPYQTNESWNDSLDQAVASGVPHVSVYMLEVDEDSRLGRELIAGGTRYHAHFVPDDDATADFYLSACERLAMAGILQYEISNFARDGRQSRHNLKYWERQPYLGFGVDAHSMLPAADETSEAMRFSSPDSLDAYMNRQGGSVSRVSRSEALEESFFLGLRLNRGVDLEKLRSQFGDPLIANCHAAMEEGIEEGLMERIGSEIRLTPPGRLMSNDVFVKFLGRQHLTESAVK